MPAIHSNFARVGLRVLQDRAFASELFSFISGGSDVLAYARRIARLGLNMRLASFAKCKGTVRELQVSTAIRDMPPFAGHPCWTGCCRSTTKCQRFMGRRLRSRDHRIDRQCDSLFDCLMASSLCSSGSRASWGTGRAAFHAQRHICCGSSDPLLCQCRPRVGYWRRESAAAGPRGPRGCVARSRATKSSKALTRARYSGSAIREAQTPKIMRRPNSV